MNPPAFVLCVRNAGYEVSLEVRKVYEVMADESALVHGMLRVIDESGFDYLFPKEMFVDIKLPEAVAALLSTAA